MSTQEQLKRVHQSEGCTVYELPQKEDSRVRRFIASTPESRAICNDPLVVGVDYTEKLKRACAKILGAFNPEKDLGLTERETSVLHILRGGLNFGLRDALHLAYGWNTHASAFVSAQRARRSDNPEDWYITENAYLKVPVGKSAAVIFGDVVATGTSLEYALKRFLDIVQQAGSAISAVVFFTIGGARSEEIVEQIDRFCRKSFPGYRGASVIYIEGRFSVADPETKLTIKYTGTDLLRLNCAVAPEFTQSQYENHTYPLERCTIYDAGSRAFYLPEYLEDLRDYWEKTLKLAEGGMTFSQLLAERIPELDASRFGAVELKELCRNQLRRIHNLEAGAAKHSSGSHGNSAASNHEIKAEPLSSTIRQ